MPHRLIVVALLTATLLLPSVARAAPVPKAEALELHRAGVRAAKRGRYAEAIRLMQRAHRLWPAPRILRNLALVYLEMRKLVVAATYLHRYLRQLPAARRKQLPAPLRKLQSKVGVLRVQAWQPGVTIWIDGRRSGAGSVERPVLPGTHSVELRHGDRVLLRQVLRVVAGQTRTWRPPRPAPRARRRPLHTGPQRSPGHAGKRAGLHWGYFTAAAVVAGAAGTALLAVGVKTLQLESDYGSAPTESLRLTGNRYKLASNVLLGVTLGTVATAALLAIFTRFGRPERALQISVTPTVAPGGGSVFFHGRF